MTTRLEIPVIDLKGLFNAESFTEDEIFLEVAKEFRESMHGLGFAYLSNHGLPQDLIKRAFEDSKAFFELEAEVKGKYKKTDVEVNNHGYTALNQELLDLGNSRECKESYDINGAERYYPEEVPTFEESLESLEKAARKLIKKLLTILAMSIKLENVEFFNEVTRHLDDAEVSGLSTLRTLFYPPIGNDVRAGDIRCAEHTDYGLITLLFQDSAGGLQVRNPNGEWIDATPIPGTIVVNAGDLLDFWTSGYFPGTPHRVIIPEEEVRRKFSRQSIASFVCSDNHVDVHPFQTEILEKVVDCGPINSYGHIMKRNSKAYGKQEN